MMRKTPLYYCLAFLVFVSCENSSSLIGDNRASSQTFTQNDIIFRNGIDNRCYAIAQRVEGNCSPNNEEISKANEAARSLTQVRHDALVGNMMVHNPYGRALFPAAQDQRREYALQFVPPRSAQESTFYPWEHLYAGFLNDEDNSVSVRYELAVAAAYCAPNFSGSIEQSLVDDLGQRLDEAAKDYRKLLGSTCPQSTELMSVCSPNPTS